MNFNFACWLQLQFSKLSCQCEFAKRRIFEKCTVHIVLILFIQGQNFFFLVCSSVIWLVFYWLSWNRKIYLWCGKREEVRWCYYCWNQRKLPRKMQLFFPPLVKLFFCSRCSFTIFPKLDLQDSVKVAKITVQNTICSNNGFEKSFALFVHCEQIYSMKSSQEESEIFF